VTRPALAAVALLALATPAAADEAAGSPTPYLDFKNELQDRYNLDYGVLLSIFPQFGTQPGGRSIVSTLITPTITWSPVEGTKLGDGALTVSFTRAQYWTGANGITLQHTIGAIATPNDWTFNEIQQSQYTWTQKLPGDILEITVGQYPMSNIDTNLYAGNQQTNFLNFSLSQTASQTYPNAGLGAYAQMNLPHGIQILGGIQNASDVSGETFTDAGFARHEIAWFAAAGWSGNVPTLGAGKYMLFGYGQPSVPDLPHASQGISFNGAQRLTERWAAFVMANQASGSLLPVQASISAGLILTDPWGRNPQDQFGIGLAWNRTNRAAYPDRPVRDSEVVAEAYDNFAILPRLTVAPDVQVYANPALKPGTGPAVVLSLRATAAF